MINKSVLFDVVLKSAERKPRTYITRQQVMTNDKNSVEINFRITDATPTELSGATATVYLYMQDGSFFQKTNADIARENNIFKYVLKENEAKHKGIAQTQIVVKVGTSETASPLFDFDIVGGLETKPIVEREIQDWTTLTAEAKAFVDQIEGFTLDQFVENKMGEELANLEANYATRLTGLESNDSLLTAQLAQKASKEELNALGELKLAGEYATLTDLVNAYPIGSDGVFLVIDDGFIYRWDQTRWVQTVRFQSTGIAEKSVSYSKQSAIEFIASDNLFKGIFTNYWIDSTTGQIQKHPTFVSAVIEINPQKNYDVRVGGVHNRFVVGVANNIEVGEKGDVIYVESQIGRSKDSGVKFTNTEDNKYLIVGVDNTAFGDSGSPTLDVRETDADLDFNYELKIEVSEYSKSEWVNFESHVGGYDVKDRCIIYPINQNAKINIQTFGAHDRFTVYGLNVNNVFGTNELIYKGTNNDGMSSGNETFDFYNIHYKFIYIGLSSNVTDLPSAVYVKETIKTKPTLSNLRPIEGDISQPSSITASSEIYPVLFGVKTTNEKDGEIPRPLGWLYYHPETYDIYYASGSPENMKYLCSWKSEVTWNGSATPTQYRPFITKYGDIIFVWRGDDLGYGIDIPNVRQNPIVYPAGNWNNPIEVKLTGVKPTSWLQNCGAEYVYNADFFMFAEYTRPSHIDSHVWKVTKPFTNPSNWKIVKSFPLSGDNNIGFKHCHTVNYDPFSKGIFLSTGDDSESAKIYVSYDFGETFSIVLEGDEKYCRVLNLIFTKDNIYWATDSGKPNMHYLLSVPRNDQGIPDFTLLAELYKFPYKDGQAATYVTAYLEDPHGLLILDRFDGPVTTPLDVYFWSFEDSSMHVISTLHPTDSVASMYGFRVEAVNWYPQKGQQKISLGFGSPRNFIDLLSNSGDAIAKNINNYSLGVKRDGESYRLIATAAPLMG